MTVENTAVPLRSIIESILFVAGRPVETAALARIAGADQAAVLEAVEALAEDYRERGLRIQRNGAAVQLVTAPESAPYVQAFFGVDENQRLTKTVLAVLTVIAYKQPITKGQIEKILGRSADYSIETLKARDLITEVGRASGPGRPYLYGTTFRFLEHFGLERPEDLPPLPELEAAEADPEAREPADEAAGP
jgi:segregation and condensation protein B